MSKNSSYLKSNYPGHSPISIQEREKNMSLSPHNNRAQRKTVIQSILKNEILPSTEAKRQRQNDQEYIDYMAPRTSIYQQKTNKKSTYQKPSPLKPSSINYANTLHTNMYPSVNGGKVEILKEQNIYLTQQNVHLNELLSEKSKIILTLQKKLQYQVQQQVITLEQIQREKNKFLIDFHQRDDLQRIQIQKLLIQLQHSNEQITRLRIQMDEVIQDKDQQVESIKSAYGEENRHILQNVIGKKDIQITTLQSKLTEVTSKLREATIQLQGMQNSSKQNQEHLNQQIKRLMEEIEQVNHQRKIQLSEQKIAYDNIILTINKEKQQDIANTVFKCDVELKRYKNLLNQQMLTNNHLQRQIQSAKLQHSNETQQHLHSQNQLKHQLYEIENYYQQKHHNEMSKQKQINGKQTRMVEQTIQMKDKQYESEMDKLINVNRQQRAEIQRLLTDIDALRRQKREQIERIQKVNVELRQKIAEISQATEDQTETLKVKLGQLRHCDITSLKNYYEHQLKLKSQQIMDLQKMIKQSRDKLHKQLQDKVLEKKFSQKLVDDLRIKIGEMELKMAMMNEQHKQKIHSMGSQIEMTSMTLIRETAQKQKYSQQSQIQRRNLQEIIITKDSQIQQLNNKITLIKKSHIEEIEEKVQTITIFQQKTSQLNEQIKRQREFYQKQVQKKEQLKKQIKQFYQQEIQKEKDTYSREFSEVTQRLMKQKNQLNVKLQHFILLEKQLRQQLALHAEHHEQRTMQQDVARNQEKSRLQYAKQTMEIGLKNYYEKRITDIQEELNITRQQLNEKAQDVRNLTDKNYKLEKKIQKIIESQQKMRVLQEKVMALGQENNLVKNVAQLSGTKSRRKPV